MNVNFSIHTSKKKRLSTGDDLSLDSVKCREHVLRLQVSINRRVRVKWHIKMVAPSKLRFQKEHLFCLN